MLSSRRKHVFFILLALALVSSRALRAEEDVELALEPPDSGDESQLKEQLDEAESQAREPAENPDGEPATSEEGDAVPKKTPEAEVPQINDNVFESHAGTEQMKLLRYHRQLMTDRDLLASSGDEDPPLRFHVSAGVHFGISATSINQANIDFQIAVAKHFALGTYANYSPSSTLGAFTINYYSRQPYEGIWVQLGAGYERFASGSNNVFNDSTIASTSPVVLDVGWRWLGDSNLTFAFGAGINGYFFVPSPTVQFNVKLQLGLAWNIWPH